MWGKANGADGYTRWQAGERKSTVSGSMQSSRRLLSGARIHYSLSRSLASTKIDVHSGPGLAHFIKAASASSPSSSSSSSSTKLAQNAAASALPVSAALRPLKFHIETYGCQMNVSDSDIVSTLLVAAGHKSCPDLEEAELILTNTCAVRDNAEQKVWHRLKYFQSIRRKKKLKSSAGQQYPLVGVLGCMAERLKDKLLLEESVDFICGPDAYRDIPRLLEQVVSVGQKQANTVLSYEETYADINPIREVTPTSAFVSIMRGCNNMCSFCIVPFTRGRERSRPMESILREIQDLSSKGVKEVVLLGQNVNGYHDTSDESAKLFPTSSYKATPGFSNLYRSKKRDLPGARFPDLLRAVAAINPEMRVRFTSPHPKDFPEEVLEAIAEMPNICAALHLPLQSGSSTTLERMRRGYTREAFLSLVDRVRSAIPGVALSTDVISGFCDETEQEHQETLALLAEVQFEQAFMYAYSLRDRTHAAHTMQDNVPEDIKQRRLREVIDVFRTNVALRNSRVETDQLRVVLVEGQATKSTPANMNYTGRTDGNKRVVFPAHDVVGWEYLLAHPELLHKPLTVLPEEGIPGAVKRDDLVGQYVLVRITNAHTTTMRGMAIAHVTLQAFHQHKAFFEAKREKEGSLE